MMTCLPAFAALFAGCGELKMTYTEKQMFRLCAGTCTPEGQDSRAAGLPLLVKRLDISPAFGSAEFVYRVGPNRFTQDYYNNYMTPPARLISDALLEALVNSPQFSPVSKNMIPKDVFQLWGKITALYCDQRSPNALEAVVALSLNLDRLNKEGFTPVLAKTYSSRVPLGTDISPNSYITALNQGLAGIVNDLLWDFQNLQAQPTSNQIEF